MTTFASYIDIIYYMRASVRALVFMCVCRCEKDIKGESINTIFIDQTRERQEDENGGW